MSVAELNLPLSHYFASLSERGVVGAGWRRGGVRTAAVGTGHLVAASSLVLSSSRKLQQFSQVASDSACQHSAI